MSAGRWHHSIILPSGQKVTADYREHITMVMHRVAAAWSDGQDAELSDLEQIMAWQEGNRQQIQACQEGRCDHVVV